MNQTSIFICGLSILALTSVEGYNGYVIFVWVYGIFLGNTSSTHSFPIPPVNFVYFFAPSIHLSLSIPFYPIPFLAGAGILEQSVGTRNQVGIGLMYRPAGLCCLTGRYDNHMPGWVPSPQ